MKAYEAELKPRERITRLVHDSKQRANVCVSCRKPLTGTGKTYPKIRYIVTGHDHTDEHYAVCVCT